MRGILFFHINRGNIEIHTGQSDSNNILSQITVVEFIFSQCYAKVSDYRAVGPADLRIRSHIMSCGCLVFCLEKLSLATIDLKKKKVFDVKCF